MTDHDRRRRLRRLRVLLPVAVILLAVGSIVAVLSSSSSEPQNEPRPVPEPPEGPDEVVAPSGPPAVERLGFYPKHPNHGGLEDFRRLERWLGRELRYMVQFGDAGSPEFFRDNMQGQFSEANLGNPDRQSSFRLAYSVPLSFRSGGSPDEQWDMLIDDTDDRREVYEWAARLLDKMGYGDAIIRLAWEFDNPSSPWYAATDPDKFKQAWRVVHEIFRSVSTDFEFDYNFIRGAADRSLIREAYPGDAYVDVIGLDHYDHYTGPGGVPEGRSAGFADPGLAWDQGYLPDLQAHVAFARERGKPVSFPEWGLSTGGRTKAGSAGGDNPTYIQRMYEWFNYVGGPDGPGLVYTGYFQEDSSPDGMHGIQNFAESSALFRELFGAG